MSRLRNWIVAGLVLLLARRRPRSAQPDETRILPAQPPNPAAELCVLGLLGLSSLCAVGFILVYAFGGSLPAVTQLLGLAIGLSLLFLAAALVVVGLKLVPQEEVAGEYPPEEHPGEQQVIAEVIDESGSRFTRARLFKLGLAGAGGTIGLALLTPAVSFGPLFHVGDFLRTPWRRGRRLVDENGRPLQGGRHREAELLPRVPRRAGRRAEGADGGVARRDPPRSRPAPPSAASEGLRRARDPRLLADLHARRLCDHALPRAALQPDEPRPALVCPCHYSTFDPASGGTVTFGPAGRNLPLLPLYEDSRGYLRAKGNFDGPVGPSWWGVRMWKAQP